MQNRFLCAWSPLFIAKLTCLLQLLTNPRMRVKNFWLYGMRFVPIHTLVSIFGVNIMWSLFLRFCIAFIAAWTSFSIHLVYLSTSLLFTQFRKNLESTFYARACLVSFHSLFLVFEVHLLFFFYFTHFCIYLNFSYWTNLNYNQIQMNKHTHDVKWLFIYFCLKIEALIIPTQTFNIFM